MCVRLRMEGNGVGYITATVATPGEPNFTAHVRTFFAIAVSGFHRHAAYRQATVAAATTNSMFGFLRIYVLLSVTGATGLAAGYGAEQLATYVWVGQGLIGVVMFWGWSDLSERVRSGDIVTDLLRPIHPVVSYLATDLGRATHAVASRFVPPVLLGAIFFDLYAPTRAATYPVFVLSTLLATVACFGCRYLVNATSYWLLDIRGVLIMWTFTSGILSGLYFPLRFLPDWLATTLWLATPFPSILQTPLDVIVERDALPAQLGYVGLQAAWAVALLLACRAVQARAERRLVIQGG
jgi:ABC-2 type transport system permease protein